MPVLYDPKDPQHAALDGFSTLWLNAACITFFGAALLLSVLHAHNKEEDARMLGRPPHAPAM